ncbi:MAG: MFS transporter [Candidatus Eremiobacteraeota bacterium]|nr:MFS transporter [Candidatus Eremiobacteraeota bacterium]
MLSPALPALGASFGVGPRSLAWVFTLYLLANVVAIPIATQLADRLGRRPVYIACVAVFAVGSVIAISAPTFTIFLLARAIQAAGAGGIFPVATAAIADRVPLERRGAALGLVAATWGLAAILGPIVGGLLTHLLSWHWIFAANIPLALIVIALARTNVPATAAHVRGPLDVLGIALLAIGLLAMMVALTGLEPRTAIVAAVCFLALAFVERRAEQPVISPALLRNRQILVTFGLEILIGTLEGSLFFIPAALVAAQHLTVAVAGGVAAIGAFTFVATIPLAGRAIDAVGSRLVLAAGTLLCAGGLTMFALRLPALGDVIVALIIAGVGFGALLGPPTRYIVTREVPATGRATALGLLSILLIVGQIVGGSLAGGVIGNSAAIAGFAHAYLAFAAIALIALALSLALREAPRPAG